MSDIHVTFVVFSLEDGGTDKRVLHIGSRLECGRVFRETQIADYNGPVRAISAQVQLGQWMGDHKDHSPYAVPSTT